MHDNKAKNKKSICPELAELVIFKEYVEKLK